GTSNRRTPVEARSRRLGVEAEGLSPLEMRSSKRKSANHSRPGSQAPHAPPALTFGPTGKQKVKSGRTGWFLIHPVRRLPQNIKDFTRWPSHFPQPSRCGPSCLASDPISRRAARPAGLVAQEIGEIDALGLERLWIQGSLGQARQGVGFEVD